MLELLIHLECEVEDTYEALAKFKAVRTVLSVYPFLKVKAEVHKDLELEPKGEVKKS